MNSNKPYKRVDRINRQILDILSDILIKNIDLSHLGFITFTSVDVAPDLRTAKVFYSVLSGKLPDSKVDVEINKKQKAFKKFMSPQLSLRYTPDIRFILDETLAYSEKIDNLLKDQNEIHRSK
ncbi:MAG: ribosome-binding factor A [Candidatus Neomarinimicrobiota bacterium]|nr:MAG: ribosome-binding factor A [Candidatus Neomarinimicrobiota bacterium]